MLSQAKVGTEQIRDYSNTDKFYTLRLFDYGNYVIFYLILAKKVEHNWKHTCVFCACKKYSSVCFSWRSSIHQDWRHCFIWILKLASMAILFNHFILSGAIVCVLCYGKSETRIYFVSCIFNSLPTPKVSTIQVLVAACECDQRCRCVYLHWKLSVKRMIIR